MTKRLFSYSMSIHHKISCDICRKRNFSIHRYKCLICNDFDLCANCYEKKSNHAIYHPMQLVITSNDYESIYFGVTRTSNSPVSLTCPLCNRNGFSLDFLIKHIDEKHSLGTYSILCPICFKRQNNLSEHLNQHMKKIFHTNENQSKLVSERSLLEKFLSNNSNKNENQQRNLFIQNLLTDLLCRNIEINHHQT